jgi:hypothetical protein
VNRWFFAVDGISGSGEWVDLGDAYGPCGEEPQRLVGVLAWVDDDSQDQGAFRVFRQEDGDANPIAVLPLATTAGAGPVVPCSYPLDLRVRREVWVDIDGAVPTAARFQGFYMILEGECSP